jgi:hypothetical protein
MQQCYLNSSCEVHSAYNKKWVPRNCFGGKFCATRTANISAVLVVQNVKLWIEAQHSILFWMFVTCYGKVLPFKRHKLTDRFIFLDNRTEIHRPNTSCLQILKFYFNFEILSLIVCWTPDVSNFLWRYSPPCYILETFVWIVKSCRLAAILQRNISGQN